MLRNRTKTKKLSAQTVDSALKKHQVEQRETVQQPWPESSEQFAYPDVKSKLQQLPKHSYVITLMGRWLL